MNKTIKLKSNEELIFNQWLTLLSSIPPFNSLQPKEREVTAMISSLYFKYRKLSEKEIEELIFSKTNRELIMEKTGISNKQVFNNLLTVLRKKGVLEGNRLNNIYKIYPESNNNLIFNLSYE